MTEYQWFPWWVYLLAASSLLAFLPSVVRAVRGRRVGRALLLLLFALPCFLFLGVLRMKIAVEDCNLGVSLGLVPMSVARINLREVIAVDVLPASAVRWYAGYGIRVGTGQTTVLRAGQSDLVRVALRSGRSYLIGTARPSELAALVRGCIQDPAVNSKEPG